MSIHSHDYIWSAFEHHVCGEQQSDEMKKLIIGLCTDHSEDFFNQNICLIKESKSNDKMLIFFAMCMFSQNLSLIKQMVEDVKCDVNQTTEDGLSCLSLGLTYNENFDVIKYLVESEDCKLNMQDSDYDGTTCLMRACMGQDLNVIKYLIEECELDVNQIDCGGCTCLSYACINNPNLSVIQYLVEECELNSNHYSEMSDDCLINALLYNNNVEIAIYLMTLTGLDLSLPSCLDIPIEKWDKMILGVCAKGDFEKFHHLLDFGIFKYRDEPLLAEFMQGINPMLLISRPSLFSQFCIQDPMDPMFPMKKFVKLTDDLNWHQPIPMSEYLVLDQDQDQNQDKKSSDFDFSRQTSLVFIYNGTNYYADPEIVFNQLILFKEIKDLMRFDDPITLSTNSGVDYPDDSSKCLPRYVINLWIRSMYTKKIDLMNIESKDIVCALDHIDRYPTDSVSIKSIEHQLIEYFDPMYTNDQSIYLKYLTDLCVRYGLKYLYLWVKIGYKDRMIRSRSKE
jgi:hypothetical protein